MEICIKRKLINLIDLRLKSKTLPYMVYWTASIEKSTIGDKLEQKLTEFESILICWMETTLEMD